MRIHIEMEDGKGGVINRDVEVPDQISPGPELPTHDAGIGAWDAGPAPALSQLLAKLPTGSSGQRAQMAPSIPAQPLAFIAEASGLKADSGGRDAGPAPRRNAPVPGSPIANVGASTAPGSGTGAPKRDAGAAKRTAKK